MTIAAEVKDHAGVHEQFRKFLLDLGVHDFHGLEILKLIRLCANAYESVTSEGLRNQQISEQRWRLLLRLLLEEQHGNSDVNPTHLAHTQNVSKNTISSLLRSLEEQQLIERTLDATDRRQFRIRLTESGRTLVSDSLPSQIAFLNQLTAALNSKEVDQLHQLLFKLHSSIHSCHRKATNKE